MRKLDVEMWARKVVNQVIKLHNCEDDYVECKATWIKEHDAAKRIAGLANAGRGEPVMWLVGVDDKAGTVGGADKNELANWWPIVRKSFDETAPIMMHDLNVYIEEEGKTVVALVFDTGQAPYVIKEPGGMENHFIYWREGTRLRTAKRSEMLRALIPQVKFPTFEVLGGVLTASAVRGLVHPPKEATGNKILIDWQLLLAIYVHVEGKREFPIVFPFHQLNASFQIPGESEFTPFHHAAFETNQSWKTRRNALLDTDTVQLMIEGPGIVDFRGIYRNISEIPGETDSQYLIETRPSLETKSIIISGVLQNKHVSETAHDPLRLWKFGEPGKYGLGW